jgi:hypothetical protein
VFTAKLRAQGARKLGQRHRRAWRRLHDARQAEVDADVGDIELRPFAPAGAERHTRGVVEPIGGSRQRLERPVGGDPDKRVGQQRVDDVEAPRRSNAIPVGYANSILLQIGGFSAWRRLAFLGPAAPALTLDGYMVSADARPGVRSNFGLALDANADQVAPVHRRISRAGSCRQSFAAARAGNRMDTVRRGDPARDSS